MSEIRLEGQEPSEFELQLTRALRRVEAPEGFAARVMDRAATPAVAKNVVMMPARLRAPMWIGGAVAAILVVGAFVGETVHVRHQREEAALATQQFDAAVRVTDHALDKTRLQLQRAGLNLGE
jgi:type VI protein secretion system component VasF